MTATAQFVEMESLEKRPHLEPVGTTTEQAPETSAAEWIQVDDTWYEIGAALPPRRSKTTYRALGQKVIVQSIDAIGEPKQRIQPIPAYDPACDRERWQAMSEADADLDIKVRRSAAEQCGPKPVPPIVGRLALAPVRTRLMIERPTGPPLLTGEHSEAPGRPSHRIHPVRSEVKAFYVSYILNAWQTSRSI